MDPEKVLDPTGNPSGSAPDGGVHNAPLPEDVEKQAKNEGFDVTTTRQSEEKMRPRFFDGTATLTVGGDVILIPTPSCDPRGKRAKSSAFPVLSISLWL